MEINTLDSSQLRPAPFPILDDKDILIECNNIEIKYNFKIYPLKIMLTKENIIINIQEKYNLYYYESKKTYKDFLNLHKYFRLFDNIKEIYDDLLLKKIVIKEEDSNKGELILKVNFSINNINNEINLILKKKELDKIKDIDLILENYMLMKKELDELKQKFLNNIFFDSVLIKDNYNGINLIKEGIKHQLKKDIKSSILLYRCTRDGDDRNIFHEKCDGKDNTLIIGESTNGRIFGGFTTQKWENKNQGRTKNDEYAFLFQINDLQNYYAIKGKGGIFCKDDYGPTFGNNHLFEFCFQDKGKALEKKNRDETGHSNSNSFYYENKKHILEGNSCYTLKDYEVFKILFN